MPPLCNALPDRLQNPLELLDRPDDPALDQLQLRHDRRLHVFQRRCIAIHVGDRVFCIRVFGFEPVFTPERVENGGEVLSEVDGVCEKFRNRLSVRLAVLEELLGCLLN